jgi:hypothetical protein
MGWPDILAKATLSRAETMLALLKAASKTRITAKEKPPPLTVAVSGIYAIA